MLQHQLENAIPHIFAEQTVAEKIINKRDCYEYILSLRLEAKCGIEAISTMMNRFGYPNNSVGFISQALNNIGSLLDNTLSTNQQTIQLVIYASDEIFSTSKPILITVDPVIVNELKHIGISEDVLKDFCLAWQYRKNMIKAKHLQRRNFYKNKEKDKLAHLQQIMGQLYAAMVDIVYTKLDTIVQSAALVETINSIVRAYLNTTRNHISQNLLNLIMFYHNHRRYRGGKRKGKTPLEILTRNKQEKDWIQLLFEKVEKKAPTFFLE